MSKDVTNKFKKELKFHPIPYAGQDKREDWQLAVIDLGYVVIMNEDARVMCYGKHLYLSNLRYQYANGYFLLAGKLYDCEGKDLKINNSYAKYCNNGIIEKMIFYEKSGLMELVMSHYSKLMYNDELLTTRGGSFFKLKPNSITSVLRRNGVIQIDTVDGCYYVSCRKKIAYSEERWIGKRLRRKFYEYVE